MNLLSNKIFKRIFEGAFFIWGVVITALYFYYYPQYTLALVFALEWLLIWAKNLLGIAIFFLAGFFLWVSFLRARGESERAKNFLLKVKGKWDKLPEKIPVPLSFFPLYILASAFLWIGYIFKRSKDLSIVGNDLAAVFFSVVLLLVAFGLGRKILGFFKFQFSSWLEKFLLSEAIGFGALMMIMYALGMTHLYYRSVAYVLIGSILFFTRHEIFGLLDFVRKGKVSWKIRPFLSFQNFLCLAIALIVGVYVAGMFQQYPLGWDTLHTYAAFPKAYTENHGIVNFKYWFFSGFPQNGEMIFTLGYLINGFPSVSGILFVFSILISLLLLLISKYIKLKSLFLLPVLIYLVSPINFHFNIEECKIDEFLVFYSCMALYFLIKFFIEKRFIFFVVACVLTGISAGIKYNFLSIFFPAFLFLVFFNKELAIKRRLSLCLIMASIVGIFFLPWGIKNIKYSSNPVEPIFGDRLSEETTFLKFIDKKGYSKSVDNILSDGRLWYEYQEIKSFRYYFSLPFHLTYNIKSRNNSDQVNPGTVYLFFLPLLVWAFIKKEKFYFKNNGIIQLVYFSILSVFFWFFATFHIIWYIFPTLVALTVVISYLVEKYEIKKSKIAFIAKIFVIIFFVPFFARGLLIVYSQDTLIYKNGNDNPLISMSEYINKNTGDKLIWNLGIPVNYYIHNSDKRVIHDQFGHVFRLLNENKKEEDVLRFLNGLNIEYFLYEGSGGGLVSWALTKAEEFEKSSPVAARNFISSYEKFFRFRDKYLYLDKQEGNLYLYKLK